MIETLTAERQAPLNAAFDRIFATCQWLGDRTRLSGASVTRLEYAFFTDYNVGFINGIEIGQSISYVHNETQVRTTDINICIGEDGSQIGAIDAPGDRSFSVIRLIDQGDFTEAGQLKPTGIYIARSNENPDQDLTMFEVGGEGHDMRLRFLSDEEQLNVAAKLQQFEASIY